MKKISNAKPYQGILIFAVAIIFLLIVLPIQNERGISWLIITEVGLLLIGLLSTIFFKDKLKNIIPIKRPGLRQVYGVLTLWTACYIVNLLITQLLLFFFPQFIKTSNTLQNFFTNTNFFIALIIGAILPAVCEEVLHRGVILNTFKNVKKQWLTIIAMGIIFGVFHLDMFSFLPTAFLGAVLTYIMIKTNNILLPMIFHFFNNLTSIGLGFILPYQPQTSNEIVIIGVNIIMCSVAPYLIYLGIRLLNSSQTENYTTSFNIKKIIVATALIIALGSSTIALSSMLPYTFQSNISRIININSQSNTYTFTVNKTKDYFLQLSTECERGIVVINIVDEQKHVVYSFVGADASCQKTLKLKNGVYQLIVKPNIKKDKEYFESLGFTYNDLLIKNFKLTDNLTSTSKNTYKISIR